MSFSNQALKNVPRTYQIDLLEKHQASRFISYLCLIHHLAGLKDIGFEVSQRVMEVDPIEIESSEDGESDSGSSS